MTANEVARETGWAMHGWGHGDRATNEAFAPLETYAERFDALLGRAAHARLRRGRPLGRAPEHGLGDGRARRDRT